jgi:hypothetical protein
MIAKKSLHKQNVIKYSNSMSSLNVAVINKLNTSEL